MSDAYNNPGTLPRQKWHWIPGIIRNDFWRKLVALFLALLLYVAIAVRLSGDERVENIPVNLVLPGSLVNLDDSLPKVALNVRGSKSQLANLSASMIRIRAEVDGNNYIAGEPYTLRLRPQDVRLPHGLRVVEISPRDLSLNLDRMVSLRVPVRERFDSLNELPDNYMVGEVRFTPREVVISGPESLVRSINQIYTQPIPLDSRLTESFEYLAPLRIPGGVSCDREQVEAQVEIEKALATRTFRGIPVQTVQSVGNPHKLMVKSIAPKNIEVTVSGPRGALSMMRSEELKAYLDLNKISEPGTYQLNVSVVVENNRAEIAVKAINPSQIETVLQRE